MLDLSASQSGAKATEVMEEQFVNLRKQLDDLTAMLEADEALATANPQRLGEMRDVIFSFTLALTLYTEANKAVQAGAWFAATAVAASALEAVLLARCFLEQDKIKELPKWTLVKRSQKADFRLFVRSLDLGKLLDIAEQLAWFPTNGIPNTFLDFMKLHLDKLAFAEFVNLFSSVSNVGQACANHVREYRNLLHPAVCLKEGRQPSATTGMTATFMFLIAFSSLSEG